MFSYVILHYKSINDTIKCLDNLRKNISEDSHIIVVDNNSLNENEEKRIRKYTDDLIKLIENVGYAKANNIGIKYASDKYDSKYYVVINNDVFISQKNFENNIEYLYKKYDFDILGPKILSTSGESINPFPVLKNKELVKNEIKKCKKLIKIYSNPFLTYLLEKYIYIKHVIKKPIKLTNGINDELNVALHGCAIIFSKKYINKYEYAFYNETFLFHEEEFLYQRILNDSIISIYSPSIEVFHKEGSSTNIKNSSIRLSKLFREKERLKSLIMLLNILSDNSDK